MNNEGLKQIIEAIDAADVSLLDLLNMEESERNEIINACAVLRKFAAESAHRLPLKIKRPSLNPLMHGTISSAIRAIFKANAEPVTVPFIHHELTQAGFVFKHKAIDKQRAMVSGCLTRRSEFEHCGVGLWKLKEGESP